MFYLGDEPVDIFASSEAADTTMAQARASGNLVRYDRS
jgi:hypothetical protein